MAQKRFPSFFTDEAERALDSLADAAYRAGDYKAAIIYGETLLGKIELRSGTQDSTYGYFSNYLGFMNLYVGNYSAAEKLFLQAERIYTNINGEEHKDVVIALGGLAKLYNQMEHYEKAEKILLKTKRINIKLVGTEHQAYANTLIDLAELYRLTGRYTEAEALYLEGKGIYVKIYGPTHDLCSAILSNIASLYQDMYRYEEAESLYLEALHIDEQTRGNKHPSYALKLYNLARLYFKTERYEEGEKKCLEAQEIQKKLGGEHPNYIHGLTILATAYRDQGRHEEAIGLFLKVRRLYKEVFGINNPKYGATLFDLANTYFEMGRYEEALLLQLESLKITENKLGIEHEKYAKCWNALGKTYWRLNNITKTKECLRNGLKAASGLDISLMITKEWKDSLVTANYSSVIHIEQALDNLNYLHLLLEQEKDKNVEVKELILSNLAHDLLERIRKLHTNSDSKLRILGRGEGWASRGLDLLNRKRQVKEAFDLAEAQKSVLLLEATKSEKAYQLGFLPDSLMLREKVLFKDRDELEAGIIKASRKFTKDSLRIFLNAVQQDIHAFVGQIEQDYPDYAQLKYQKDNVTLTEIQALLEPKTALLEYVITDSVLYLFYIDKNKYKMSKQAIRQHTLKAKINELHTALSDYELLLNNQKKSYEAYTRPAHWFYKKLIAPIMDDASGIEHLIIVPDGELAYLPFEAFLVEPANQGGVPNYINLDYLLEHYKISYNYSATLWRENKQGEKKVNNGQMLAMAGNYDLYLDSTKKHFRLSDYYRNRNGLKPLYAAQKEVRVLSKEFQGYFGFDKGASERLFKEKAGNYAVIHLAVHGALDSRHPILSSLIFTEDGDSLENSLLQAYEISNLKLNADLVVLSACETGFGAFEKGNGIASLARSFMYAGASSMVVTLWSVNDHVTAKIMKDFYSNLSDGMNKSEALQQAKLNFKETASGMGQHPAFWSPFILVGNDEPIQILRKSHWVFWGMVLTGLLGLLGVGLYWKKRKG